MSLKIGSIIAERRRVRGLTQEALASFLGVSKPAVSKWERGISYPDIELLPVIASYFDISVDDLMGYAPELSTEQIRGIYHSLTKICAENGFDAAYSACMDYMKQYYSCWQLVMYLCSFLVNHAQFSEGRWNEVMRATLPHLERIETLSEDKGLATQSIYMQAAVYIAVEEPEKGIERLKQITEPQRHMASLMAAAYQRMGEKEKALREIQSSIYNNVIVIAGLFPNLLALYADDLPKIKQWLAAAEGFVAAFGLKELHPAVIASTYLSGVQIYLASGEEAEVYHYLEEFTICLEQMRGLQLKGSVLFDQIESLFAGFTLGAESPVHPEKVIDALRKIVLENQELKPYAEQKRFARLLERIRQCEA